MPPFGLRVASGAIALAIMGVAFAREGSTTGPSSRPSSGPTTSSVAAATPKHWQDLAKIPLPFTGTTRPEPKDPTAVVLPPPTSLDEIRSLERQVEEVAKKVTPATVCLQIGPASGSGVIVSPDGWIITAGHVSDAGDTAKDNLPVLITLSDGRKIHGVSMGANRTADNGLVRITDPGPWPWAEMGTSKDLKIGQWLVALGHPGGYHPGRPPVVRLGRLTNVTTDTLHTDNTLVGGDSGGPLFDLEGRVVGIHSRISIESVTENMHITVDSFVRDWPRISQGEIWGSLGGGGMPFPEGGGPNPNNAQAPLFGASPIPDKLGLKVLAVAKGGPAERAGLREGDIITKINGKPMTAPEWYAFLRKSKVNDIVIIEIKRADAEDQVIRVRLAKNAAVPPAKPGSPK